MATAEWIADRQTRSGETTVSGIPQPLVISGRWKLVLEGVRFARREMELTRLASWTDDPESLHFSGTGTYEAEFDLPKEYGRDDTQLLLDLGSVGHVAEIALNGQDAGVCWMQPDRLDITAHVRPGLNRIRIAVTNLLINHVTGLAQPPEVPAELVPHYGKTSALYPNGANSFKREVNFKPLPPSGLMGPVRIIPRLKVTIRAKKKRPQPGLGERAY